MTENLKQINYDIVKKVAEYLIDIYEKVTSLEVKEELRNKGYYATQKDVSKYLNDIYEDNKVIDYNYYNSDDIVWHCTDNGQYKTYSKITYVEWCDLDSEEEQESVIEEQSSLKPVENFIYKGEFGSIQIDIEADNFKQFVEYYEQTLKELNLCQS